MNQQLAAALASSLLLQFGNLLAAIQLGHTPLMTTWLRRTYLASLYRAHKRARRLLGNSARLNERAAFLGQFVRSGDLCFDVGANFGQTAVPLAMLGARVLAFEPCPEARRALRMATRQFDLIRVLPVAAGPRQTSGELYLHQHTAMSSLSSEWITAMRNVRPAGEEGWQRKVAVDVVTLDSVAAMFGAPTLIKLDVEGYELEVLAGLSCLPATLVFEHSPVTVDRTQRCLDRIEALASDVLVNYTSGDTSRFALDRWIPVADFRTIVGDADRIDVFVSRRS